MEDPKQLASLLRNAAQTAPDSPALVASNGVLSYRQLADMVSAIAGNLAFMGVKRGQIVGLNLPTQLHIPFMLAGFQLGVTVAMITPLTLAAGQVRADWIFSAAPFDEGAAEQQIIVTGALLTPLEGSREIALEGYASIDDDCLIVHSSGTTGTPKAAALSVRNVWARLANLKYWVQELPYLTLFDMGAWIGLRSYLVHLTAAATFFVADKALDALPIVHGNKLTHLECSVNQAPRLVEAVKAGGWQVSTLKSVVVTGATISPALHDALEEAFDCAVLTRYGANEIDIVSARNVDSRDPQFIGALLPGFELRIEESGEVGIRSDSMVTGYLNNPEATAEHFRDGFFYPGDLVSLDADNQLRFHGRSKDIVNAGGQKISPLEIENAVIGRLGITDAAGFAYLDHLGIEHFWLAVVGEGVDVVRLQGELQQQHGRLAPERVVSVEDIPRNANGKVTRHVLSERLDK